MVMVLLRGMHHPDPQYLTVSVREVKCTRLGYGTRLSRLHTPDPPPPPRVSINHSEEQPFSNSRLRARK
jgi:hypothetical protein